MTFKSIVKQRTRFFWGRSKESCRSAMVNLFLIALVIAVVLGLCYWEEDWHSQIIFAISSFTLVFLIRYSYDTYLMRRIQQEDFLSKSLLDITFQVINPVNNSIGGPMPPIFRLSISNQSNKIVKATVNCVFYADGQIINVPEPYTGIEEWMIFPKMEVKGYLPLVEFIKNKGIDWMVLANSQTKDNKNKKLYVTFDLVFKDEFGKSRAFRKIKYYYVFNSEQWISYLFI